MSIFYCNNKICCGGYEVEEDRSPFSHNKTQEIRIHRAAEHGFYNGREDKEGKKKLQSPQQLCIIIVMWVPAAIMAMGLMRDTHHPQNTDHGCYHGRLDSRK